MKYSCCSLLSPWLVIGGLSFACLSTSAETDVYLLEAPDYTLHVGCFGTANGNLMGYWDRHGFPNFYTGPTADGVAPLDDRDANVGIRSMWASRAGFDGRPADQPGHIDDYWTYYRSEADFSMGSTVADPYFLEGRPEHAPDCIGDFIGLSQLKWTNLNNECDGNIDGWSFVYWDSSGEKRVNYQPDETAGLPPIDIQSGLRAWTRWRGSEADVFTQLADFNPHTPSGKGFTFEDMKAEIDAGYPVLLFLQLYTEFSHGATNGAPMPRANPGIHGMLAYGYAILDDGTQLVRYRTSFGSGDDTVSAWSSADWYVSLPLRGVIGYRPRARITRFARDESGVTLEWEGPASRLYDALAGTTTEVHWYVVEVSPTLEASQFAPIGPPTTDRSIFLRNCCGRSIFFRVRVVGPPTP